MNVTWNPNWVRPFESGWSILEKFKYANVLTSRDLLRELGKNSVKNLKGTLIGRQHRGLLKYEGFNQELLKEALKININEHTHKYLSQMIGMFPRKTKPSFLLRDNLSYCKECIIAGYHSLIHQFKFIHQCPYHLCELTDTCSYCSQTLYFELSNHNKAGGFICSCSNHIVDFENYSIAWNFTLEIKNKILEQWLNLDQTAAKKIQNTYLYFPSLTSKTSALEFLLRFVAE